MPTSFILVALSAAVAWSSPVYANCVPRYCKVGEIVCFIQDVIEVHLLFFLGCKEETPIDGAVGALISFSFTFVF